MIRLIIYTALCCLVSGCCKTQHPDHVLWYDSPASAWEEMLPLGNGRLGMMPSGEIRAASHTSAVRGATVAGGADIVHGFQPSGVTTPLEEGGSSVGIRASCGMAVGVLDRY